MLQIPLHKASVQLKSRIHIRKVPSLRHHEKPINYVHQDDYYIFGVVEKGFGRGIIDFKEYQFTQGDVFLIQPGQIHRFINSDHLEGWILFADSCYVNKTAAYIFSRFCLSHVSFQTEDKTLNELTQIATLLNQRIENNKGECTNTILINLTECFINIIADTLQTNESGQPVHSSRHIEIMLSLRELLKVHIATNHQPSYYSSMLHISQSYLNEVVKNVTGINVGNYIKNEIMLRAKRMLIHTTLSVKEVSIELGFEDAAYFSRMFTQTVGISPTLFRQKNLK